MKLLKVLALFVALLVPTTVFASDIVIQVTGVSAASTENDDLEYSGSARCSGWTAYDSTVFWTTDPVSTSALAATVNAEIKEAAIAAADVAGCTVGALDKKTVLGGAVGL